MARSDAKRQPTPKNDVGRACKPMSSNSTHGRADARTDSIVPDDFSLEAALNAESTTADERHNRCPRCASAAIRSRDGGMQGSAEHLYYCAHCGFRFDYPEVGGE
jgi:predicted RNA-binding Zn-ribbon protein involved in translation (DUF1610 family)